MSRDEVFDIVDEQGRPVGKALRSQVHGNPELIHQAAHVIVEDSRGRIYLQKRSPDKDIQPGKWDTSVGGHAAPGEAPEATARREMAEELGHAPENLKFLYRYLWRSPVETELVSTFLCRDNGPFRPDPVEISEGRFWGREEIESALGSGMFTPNFEVEFRRFNSWQDERCSD